MYMGLNKQITEKYLKNLRTALVDINHRGLDWVPIRHGKKYHKLTYSRSGIIQKIKRKLLHVAWNILGARILPLLEPIPRLRYTKGLALFLEAEILQGRWDAYHTQLLEELRSRKIPDTNLYTFDYSYNIGSAQVKHDTPQIIVTYTVASLYFLLYKETKKNEYREDFCAIVDDIIKIFPRFEYKDCLCFSYTTNSNYHVHNANLHVAELMAKYAHITGSTRYDTLIRQSLNYSLRDFQKTGTYYYSGPETRKKTIDNYHTGFLARSLKAISEYWPNSCINSEYDIEKEAIKCLNFYIEVFLGRFYIYRFRGKFIQGHSVAEALLVYSAFVHNLTPAQDIHFRKTIHRSLNVLDIKNGHFCNQTYTLLGVPLIKDNLIYPRWSDSWIYFGLASARKALS